MSNRPPGQSLEDPIRDIIAGSDAFINAAHKRLESGEWTESHENILVELIGKMTHMKATLLRLARKTW